MPKITSIAIMVTGRKRRKKILKLYGRTHNLPVKLFAFTARDILWKKKKIRGLVRMGNKWRERAFPIPHAVYNQSYTNNTETIPRLQSLIAPAKCFNTVTRFNKWSLFNILRETSLKAFLPDTFLYSKDKIAPQLEKYKLIYMKPVYGSQGNQVYRVELKETREIHISCHSLPPVHICRESDIADKLNELSGQETYIIQEAVHLRRLDQQYFDIRVLVQKNLHGAWTPSATTSRVAYPNYFNTSMYQSIYKLNNVLARLLPQEKTDTILHTLRKTSVQAAQHVENHIGLLGEISVDFGLDEQNKLWIIELNGHPQKSIYNDIKNFHNRQTIYSKPIEYAYYLSRSSE